MKEKLQLIDLAYKLGIPKRRLKSLCFLLKNKFRYEIINGKRYYDYDEFVKVIQNGKGFAMTEDNSNDKN